MKAWVLLRGLARESRHWGAFDAALARRVAPVPVIALDLPGTGSTFRDASPMSVSGMVQAYRSELQTRGVVGPVGVVAMSLGAMVAIEWARAHPQELAACVLINTSLRGVNPLHHRLRPSACATLLRAAFTRDARRVEELVWALTSRRPWTDRDAVVAQWVAIRHERPVSLRNALRQLVAALRYRVGDAPLKVPTLVLCGAGDRLVHPACSQRVAHVFGWPLRTHPWAGHDLALDDGDWVVEAVAQARPHFDLDRSTREATTDPVQQTP
jgi:pimeloyl-ACP methyl ester carboxylesterase